MLTSDDPLHYPVLHRPEVEEKKIFVILNVGRTVAGVENIVQTATTVNKHVVTHF